MSKLKKIIVLVALTLVCTSFVSCGYSPHNNIYIISEKQDAYQIKTI